MVKKNSIAAMLLLIVAALNAQENQQLSEPEKIFGLSQIWKEASYNYPYFEDLKKFDWDSIYVAYIEKVISSESLIEYYTLLTEFISLLEDGHTRIIPPQEYQTFFDEPAIQIMDIEDKAIVTEVGENLASKIPIGSVIIEVNNIGIDDYMKKYKYPYISSSTDEFKKKIATLELLRDKKGNEIKIELKTPDGKLISQILTCESKDNWYKVNKNNNEVLEFNWLKNNIAYVALNTFNNDKVVHEFEQVLPEIVKSKGLIIDLRKNGGGEDDLGYSILRHIIDKPVTTYSWKTREHIAKYKAQGKWASYIPLDELSDEKRIYLKHFLGDAWFESVPDTIYPSNGLKVIVPTVILIGSFTASAAEDFLVPLTTEGRFIFIGEKTAGFTGTPYIFDLPKGGMAMINTSREMYQDGKLIRNGMQPDYEIKPTIDDIINDIDIALEKGIDSIQKRIK